MISLPVVGLLSSAVLAGPALAKPPSKAAKRGNLLGGVVGGSQGGLLGGVTGGGSGGVLGPVTGLLGGLTGGGTGGLLGGIGL